MSENKRKGRRTVLLIISIIAISWILVWGLEFFGVIQKKSYTAENFGISTVHSGMDFNGNGSDDYADFVTGARIDAENKPEYNDAYYEGGYPPDNVGVCTDVIWRAFRYAGYSLKDMVDKDIAENTEMYPRVNGNPDPNIDFRRVANLYVYFSRYAQSLTTDPDDFSQWQPGDIVTYTKGHIAIISDKRNKYGVPYIIHNSGQPVREEDKLDWGEISGHFRFDASKISDEDLIPFKSS